MKRFTLVTLLLAAMVVSAAAMVEAANTQKLTPPPDSPCPNASGSASTTYDGPYIGWVNTGWGNWVSYKYYYIYVTFQVEGLAPNSYYLLGAVGAFYTDASGSASGTCADKVGTKKMPHYEVWYWNGSASRVVVLE